MVPFDSRSAFQTSGIRLGTPAITTRGAKEDLMLEIAEMNDLEYLYKVISRQTAEKE